ncbi:MAG: hypothetical protein LHV69_06270 [Elusimicrobia bacterium]|nr:hypothetical protein [Candidatus Obscuribacterium magneticum]
MIELALRSRPQLAGRLTPQTWGRIKLSRFIELREEDFRRLIEHLEKDPLFKKLAALDKPDLKILSRRPFPNTDLSRHFYEIDVDKCVDRAPPETAKFLEKWQAIIVQAEKIGMGKFKRFFMQDGSENTDVETIARDCGIPAELVRSLRQMVDDFYLNDLTSPGLINTTVPTPGPVGVKVATIENVTPARPGEPEFRIGYVSAQYARGRYAVNYKKLFQLHDQGLFSKGEFQRVKRLIKDIELVNMRLTILYRILSQIVETQAAYFRTGKEEDLRPLTQQMLAKQLGVHRGTVHRAIGAKYVETPWGETKSLKFFLGNWKRFVKSVLTKIIEESHEKLSDEKVRRILGEKYQIQVARRTLCVYRNELKKLEEGR